MCAAPSQAQRVPENLEYLSQCFGKTFRDFDDFVRLAKKKQSIIAEGEEKWPGDDYDLIVTKCTEDLKWHYNHTCHYDPQKEASGEAMLSIMARCIAEFLNKKCKLDFKIGPKYPLRDSTGKGAKPSADMAIVQTFPSHKDRPILVYELKSEVNPKLDSKNQAVPLRQCKEMISQADILQEELKVPAIHCLTDMHNFHYFLINKLVSKDLEIQWYGAFTFAFTEADVRQHLQVISGLVKELKLCSSDLELKVEKKYEVEVYKRRLLQQRVEELERKLRKLSTQVAVEY